MNKKLFLNLFKSLLIYIVWKLLLFFLYLLVVRYNIDFIKDLNPYLPNVIIDCLSLIVIGLIFIFLSKKKLNVETHNLKISVKSLLYVLLAVVSFYNFKVFNNFILGTELSLYENKSTIYIFRSVILAPFNEELLYRFILLNFLLPPNLKIKKTSVFISIIFISLLFSLSHMNFEPSILISHFIFSLFITTIYYKTRNFLLVLLIHSLFNLSIVVFHLQYYIQEMHFNNVIIYTSYILSLLGCVFFISKINFKKNA